MNHIHDFLAFEFVYNYTTHFRGAWRLSLMKATSIPVESNLTNQYVNNMLTLCVQLYTRIKAKISYVRSILHRVCNYIHQLPIDADNMLTNPLLVP